MTTRTGSRGTGYASVMDSSEREPENSPSDTPAGVRRPGHHDPAGGFRNPWPTFGDRGSGLRWAVQRITGKLPSDPDPGEIPRAKPQVGPAWGSRAEAGGNGARCDEEHDGRPPTGIRATWVGHATFLLEMGEVNLLTDPHWSERASPVSWAGPRRLSPPGIPMDALPRIDAVLLSHDHLDHLDQGTVRRLARRYGSGVRWFAPLGYAGILRKWGAARITELDWYQSAPLTRSGTGEGDQRPETEAAARITCLPAQHWTARTPFSRNRRLWSSWSVRTPAGSVYFGGDSGWFPGYPEIGRRAGPFDLVLLPIGAYAPRWFMKPVHMDPEEAVRSYGELGGTGILAGMHWGTFRLSDEHPLEPPTRLEEAWSRAGLPGERLWTPSVGETRGITG